MGSWIYICLTLTKEFHQKNPLISTIKSQWDVYHFNLVFDNCPILFAQHNWLRSLEVFYFLTPNFSEMKCVLLEISLDNSLDWNVKEKSTTFLNFIPCFLKKNNMLISFESGIYDVVNFFLKKLVHCLKIMFTLGQPTYSKSVEIEIIIFFLLEIKRK